MDKRKLLEEALRRKKTREKLDFRKVLFGPQQAFVMDSAKHKIACCGRRSGKTYGIGTALLHEAYTHPYSNPVYICMSQVQSKYTLWVGLQELNDKFNLGLEFKKNTGDIHVPETGSTIIVRGAGSRREMDKVRGMRIPAAVIDEAQGFSKMDLDYLIDDVITPATMDFDGWIAMTGTPSAACAGGFYEAAHDPDLWSHHHWTVLENEAMINNPRSPDPAEWLERYRKKRKWSEQHPTYRREYLGQWIRDAEGMVWALDASINIVPTFPEHLATDWEFILGVDLGIIDPCAFVVGAYSQEIGELYIVESLMRGDMSPTLAGFEIEKFDQKYNFTRMVADSQGQGKAFFKHWKETTQLTIKPAQKIDKAGSVSLLNADLKAGKVRICRDRNRDLIREASVLQWDDRAKDEGKLIFDRSFQCHLSDAWLYMFREARHHAADWEINPPKPGSDEALAAEHSRLRERYLNLEHQEPEYDSVWLPTMHDY